MTLSKNDLPHWARAKQSTHIVASGSPQNVSPGSSKLSAHKKTIPAAYRKSTVAFRNKCRNMTSKVTSHSDDDRSPEPATGATTAAEASKISPRFQQGRDKSFRMTDPLAGPSRISAFKKDQAQTKDPVVETDQGTTQATGKDQDKDHVTAAGQGAGGKGQVRRATARALTRPRPTATSLRRILDRRTHLAMKDDTAREEAAGAISTTWRPKVKDSKSKDPGKEIAKETCATTPGEETRDAKLEMVHADSTNKTSTTDSFHALNCVNEEPGASEDGQDLPLFSLEEQSSSGCLMVRQSNQRRAFITCLKSPSSSEVGKPRRQFRQHLLRLVDYQCWLTDRLSNLQDELDEVSKEADIAKLRFNSNKMSLDEGMSPVRRMGGSFEIIQGKAMRQQSVGQNICSKALSIIPEVSNESDGTPGLNGKPNWSSKSSTSMLDSGQDLRLLLTEEATAPGTMLVNERETMGEPEGGSWQLGRCHGDVSEKQSHPGVGEGLTNTSNSRGIVWNSERTQGWDCALPSDKDFGKRDVSYMSLVQYFVLLIFMFIQFALQVWFSRG